MLSPGDSLHSQLVWQGYGIMNLGARRGSLHMQATCSVQGGIACYGLPPSMAVAANMSQASSRALLSVWWSARLQFTSRRRMRRALCS